MSFCGVRNYDIEFLERDCPFESDDEFVKE